MLVTKKELADILDIPLTTLTKHITQDGMRGKTGNGAGTRYELSEAIPWYVDYRIRHALKTYKPASTSNLNIEDLEAELTYWKVEKEKHKALLEAGTLVTVDTSNKEITHRLTQVRNSLDSIPFSWAPFMVGLPDVETSQKRLNEQLETLYTTLSSLPDTEEEELAYEESPEPESPMLETPVTIDLEDDE